MIERFSLLILSLLVGLLFEARRSSKVGLICLTLLAGFSLYGYSNFGDLMRIKQNYPHLAKQNSDYKKVLIHFHEIYHYYLGAKYYKELGNFGLYDAVALADNESPNPAIRQSWARDLRHKLNPVPLQDIIERARIDYRPFFTNERWQEFKNDVEYMKSIAFPGWMDSAVSDAGYNPTPALAAITSPIANLVPLDGRWFGENNDFDSIQFLPVFDLIMLGVCCFFIFKAFGIRALLIFLILYGTSFVCSFGWIHGSFFRFTWFLGLCVGICMLKLKRYMTAGAFLSLSALTAIFPFAFLLGAGWVLFLRRIRNPLETAPLIRYAVGAIITAVILIGASTYQFSAYYWKSSFANISAHKEIYFVYHIGYRKIATFDEWVPRQNFHGSDGLNRMREWSNRLSASWRDQFMSHLPLMLIMVASSLFLARRLKIEEGTMLIGTIAVFLFSIPANYYYVFLTIIPLFFLKSMNKTHDFILLLGFIAFWTFARILKIWQPDDIVLVYHLCFALFIFLISWILVRLHQGLSEESNP